MILDKYLNLQNEAEAQQLHEMLWVEEKQIIQFVSPKRRKKAISILLSIISANSALERFDCNQYIK